MKLYFRCLKLREGGKCAKERMNESKLRKQNYLLARQQQLAAPEQIFILLSIYQAEALKQLAHKSHQDFQFNTLVTDGYSAYETVLQALGGEKKASKLFNSLPAQTSQCSVKQQSFKKNFINQRSVKRKAQADEDKSPTG